MDLAIPCARCGTIFSVSEELSGRKIRCRGCGQVQRLPIIPTRKMDHGATAYPLAPEPPAVPVVVKPESENRSRPSRFVAARRRPSVIWQHVVRVAVGEASVLEQEVLALIALSAADVLVTYVLLRRGPAFYESNPIAQWFFLRWNIAGMAVFKFSAVGLAIVIGEIAERHRPGLGRVLLLVSCLATAAVVWYGLRLVFGHADNGSPL